MTLAIERTKLFVSSVTAPTVPGAPWPGPETESGPPPARYDPALWAGLMVGMAKNADRSSLWKLGKGNKI